MTSFTPLQQTFSLFAGLGVVLLIASLIGRALKVTIAKGAPHGIIDNLNARIKAWWIMVLIAGIAFMFDRAGVTLLFAFMSFLALREFVAPTDILERDPDVLIASMWVVLPVQYLLIYVGWFAGFATFIPAYVFVFLPLLAAFGGRATGYLARAAEVRWGMLYCIYLVSHVPALLSLDIPGYHGRNLLLIAFLLVVVQSSDVLQYVWGKLLGKRQVAPLLSPSKTWEGLVGGVACATALGAALFWITPFNPWEATVIALVINILGVCGGLVMSAIKRDRGAKDWGRIIEGHGGMLDRLDSMLFAAPVFYYLTRIGWT